jgi:hypothetical protein
MVMGRRRAPKRRERETVIPAFDPQDLAREIEGQSTTPTITPPFDPSSYARIVDESMNMAVGAARDTPRTLTAVTPVSSLTEDAAIIESAESIGRAMYGSYLQSDFPEALVLAERVLEKQPDHSLAQLVRERCKAMLVERALEPTSVVRLKSSPEELLSLTLDARSEMVLGQVDGITDAETIAELAGIPRAEALGRLHALVDLGVLELVSA